MDNLLEMLKTAEAMAKELVVVNDAIPAAFRSPHAVPLRARISAALDSLKAHEIHVATHPLPPAPEPAAPATEEPAAPATEKTTD